MTLFVANNTKIANLVFMKPVLLSFATATLLVSAVWLLAAADGTTKLVNSWFHEQIETKQLQQEVKALELAEKKQRLKASILEHTIREKAYRYQLDYMKSKGY